MQFEVMVHEGVSIKVPLGFKNVGLDLGRLLMSTLCHGYWLTRERRQIAYNTHTNTVSPK